MPTPTPDPIAQFNAERDAALLTLDADTIKAFMRKHDIPVNPKEDVFWASIHKARTASVTLPREARIESKRWLDERGLTSWDDGDLANP